MEGIQNRTMRHAVNTAAVGTGVAATAIGARNLCHKFELSNAIKYNACSLKASNFDKYYERISKFAEKMFPKNGKIAKAISKYAGKGFMTGGTERAMNLYKGKLAIVGAAVALAATILGVGIYKAGKIDAEGK